MSDPTLTANTSPVRYVATDHLRAVQQRMALAVLPSLPMERLGDITLLPHQRQGAARLQRIIARHGGALLADAVGLGKTFTALAVARRYAHVHILAPAGLVPMWHAALLRIGRPNVPVLSLHRASVRALPFFAAPPTGRSQRVDRDTLVIIDEAHALRNPATARYRHVAAAVVGCDVLLLSATPLHNGAADLGALAALFGGDGTNTHTFGALVVRRERSSTGEQPAARMPTVRTHTAITIPQRRETLDRIMALPAPLPAREGATAGALIRIGLLRAWCSSDAALTHAISKRLQRSSAMQDALAAGRHLSNTELRTWLIDDDASDMQLGFPELLAAHTIGADQQHSALRLLQLHSEALRALREAHEAGARADAVRAACLRTIRERHHDTPVVAFSQHARTVQALFRALSDIAGVGMLTGNHARVASGSVRRTELLEWFAPRAHGRPPPPLAQRVNLLLTTDLIAEGVNLQDAAVVVHLDLPWTHALRTQRTGRVARIGSRHRVVHEYRFQCEHHIRHVLAAERRIMRKALLAARWVGEQSARSRRTLRRARRSEVVEKNDWEERLLDWATSCPEEAPPTAADTPLTAAVVSERGVSGAVVLVRTTDGPQLLAIEQRGGYWRVSTRAAALLRLTGAIVGGLEPSRARSAAEDMPPATLCARAGEHHPRDLQACVKRIVDRWWARVRARHRTGVIRGSTPSPAMLGIEQRQARQWLYGHTSALSVVQRAQRSGMLKAAEQVIGRASSAGARSALRRWITSGAASPLIDGWRQYPELAALAADRPSPPLIPDDTAPVIDAVLFVHSP